jgi:hypothetical protein
MQIERRNRANSLDDQITRKEVLPHGSLCERERFLGSRVRAARTLPEHVDDIVRA